MMDESTDDLLYENGDDEISKLNDFRILQHLIDQIAQELSASNLDKAKHLVRMAKAKSNVIFSARLENMRLSNSEFSERNMKILEDMSK
jgi:hypothetical protein